MYTEFFGLKEVPFSIAPDPRFFFTSERHKEALAHLKYGLQGAGGFVMLTGEVGTGKTTVSRALVQELASDTIIGYIHNPAVSELELLLALCVEFGLEHDADKSSVSILFARLHQFLLANCQQQRACIVLIDEAQLLSTEVLEQLRLLTNLDHNNKKLLHIVLIGQPELQQKLKQSELRQLAQRINARYHLLPLTLVELTSYVAYRISIAAGNPGLFPPSLLKLVHHYSGGVPRLINLICDKALYLAFTARSNKLNRGHITAAAADILTIESAAKSTRALSKYFSVAALLLAGIVTSALLMQQLQGPANVRQPLNVSSTDITSTANQPSPPGTIISAKALVRDINAARQPERAMQFLYQRWGFAIKQSDASCGNSQYANLRCLQQQADMRLLQSYDLPAVVRLRDNLGQGYYATLLSISSDGVELQLPYTHIVVSQAWFEKYWSGDMMLLWTAPSVFTRSIQQGYQGELVSWIDNNVSAALGMEPASGQVFDAELSRKMQLFQRQNNLHSDGIVGTQTMMTLVHYADETVPRLSAGMQLTEMQ